MLWRLGRRLLREGGPAAMRWGLCAHGVLAELREGPRGAGVTRGSGVDPQVHPGKHRAMTHRQRDACFLLSLTCLLLGCGCLRV